MVVRRGVRDGANQHARTRSSLERVDAAEVPLLVHEVVDREAVRLHTLDRKRAADVEQVVLHEQTTDRAIRLVALERGDGVLVDVVHGEVLGRGAYGGVGKVAADDHYLLR